MSYIYFSCDWVVLPFSNGSIFHVVGLTAQKHDCCILVKGGDITEDGLFVSHFVVKALSEDVLQALLKEVSEYMTFTNLAPATEENFTGGSLIPTINPIDVIVELKRIGLINEATLKKRGIIIK